MGGSFLTTSASPENNRHGTEAASECRLKDRAKLLGNATFRMGFMMQIDFQPHTAPKF